MKLIFTLVFLFGASFAQTQSLDNTLIEKEIALLQTQEELAAYWRKVQEFDQQNRGLARDPSLDLYNWKRVLMLIKYHGFPVYETDKGPENKSLTAIPTLVFTHQSSLYLKEYFFPILLQGYRSGQLAEKAFFHALSAMQLKRYDRLLYPRKCEYLKEYLQEALPFIDSTRLCYSLAAADSCFQKYHTELSAFKPETLVWEHACKAKDWRSFFARDYLRLFAVDSTYYVQVFYRDQSFNRPQALSLNAFGKPSFACKEEQKPFADAHGSLLSKRAHRQLLKHLHFKGLDKSF